MNNDNDMFYFILMLFDEEYNRNYMRIVRRNLRDETNPYEIPDSQFRQMFRLHKQSTIDIIDALENYIPNSTVPLHLKVLATLNFVASGSYQSSVGNNYCIALSQSSMSRIIFEICEAITNHLLQEWVKYPTVTEDKNIIKQGFYEKWGARGVLGVIDGTHVDILAPPITDEVHPPFVYINRKGKHSINVMLISDSNSKIIACNARFPGSVHDSAIWQVSNIRNYLKQEYENGDTVTHLIGDSGYPLEPWLFTPIPNVEDGSPQYYFNKELTSVRNVIERTNGILKGRFRCLSKQRMLMYNPPRAANIIYSCCVLHNIAIQTNLPLQEDEIEYRENEPDNNNQNVIIENNILNEGRTIRNNYIQENF